MSDLQSVKHILEDLYINTRKSHIGRLIYKHKEVTYWESLFFFFTLKHLKLEVFWGKKSHCESSTIHKQSFITITLLGSKEGLGDNLKNPVFLRKG